MLNLRNVTVFILALLLVSSAIRAQDAATIKRAKDATAYLEWKHGPNGEVEGSATAFCIDPEGFFATTSGAIQLVGTAPLRLILDPGEAKPQIFRAAVVINDPESDLAVVKALTPGRFTPLPLGETTDLIETSSIMALGYPFGKLLAKEEDTYPTVTISTGKITSLRKAAGVLHTIQVDASLNAGNWGGPLLDKEGKVIGIFEGGIDNVSLNFAVPVDKLKTLLAKPSKVGAAFSPVSVPFEKRFEPQEWTVNILAWNRPVTDFDVELTLPGKDGSRKLKLKHEKGDRYTVKAPLIEGDPTSGKLRLAISTPDEAITGEALDRSVTVAGRSLKLSEIASLEVGASPHAVLRSGETVAGRLEGMAVVSFTVDGVTRAVDLTNARRIEVLPPKTPTEFPFSLAVKKADVAINSTGKITLTNAPDNAPGTPLAISHIAAPSITPPKLDADRVTIPLPAPADEVIVAGSGRYLVFDSRTLNQLTVFDVNTGRIAGSMKMPTAERRIAAGGDALFVLTLNREVVRWDLRTMTKDRTISLETDGAPTGITMGYASNGPLVITTNKGLMFYDPTTLARLKITVREDGANALRDWSLNASPDLWTSADGMTVVSGTANSNGFSGGLSGRYRFLTLDSGTAVVRTQTLSQAAPPLLPSHDGNQLLSGNGLVSIRDLTVPSPEQFRDMQLLPAIASNLIVATRRVAFLQDRGQEIPKLSVFSLNEPRALFTIPDLTELTRPNTETPQRGGFARGATAERGGAPVPNTPTPQRGGFGGRAGGGGGPATRGGFNEFASQRTSTPSSQIVGGQPGATAGNLEKRIFLIPSADLLVTLSYARDALVLRRIRIDDELKKSGGDYLFVANTVPRNAEKGKPYRYAMDIKSGTGGLTYKLESGPAGMTVDLDGVVTWNVPVSAASRTPVVISVRSRSGKEITHTFFIDAR